MTETPTNAPWPLSKRLRSHAERTNIVVHPVARFLLNEAADFVDANGTSAKLLEEALNAKAVLKAENAELKKLLLAATEEGA